MFYNSLIEAGSTNKPSQQDLSAFFGWWESPVEVGDDIYVIAMT